MKRFIDKYPYIVYFIDVAENLYIFTRDGFVKGSLT